MRVLQAALISLQLLVVTLPGPSEIAGHANQGIFSSVPRELKSSFKQRLNLLVKYQTHQQWERLYDLLSPLETQGETKHEYIKRNQEWNAKGLHWQLITFRPQVIRKNEGEDSWDIFGCGAIRDKQGENHYQLMATAYLFDGKWFFSEFHIVRRGIHGPPQLCTPDK